MLKPEAVTGRERAMAVAVLGRFAQAILNAHTHGLVIAVFRRSFYIRFGDEVVCVGPPGLGKGPLNVLADVPSNLEWPAVGLATQQNALRSGALLSVGVHLRFDLNGAAVWQAPPSPVFSAAELRQGLRLLADSARRRAPGGLGVLLTTLDQTETAPPHAKDDPLVQAALWPIAAIWHWLGMALAGSPEVPPSVDGLVALGPGLTPSGDDFLCGVMAALVYFGHRDIAARLAAVVLPVALRETSLISAAYLSCATQGQASAVLFDALESILAGGRDLEARLDAVHAVGHTSGWDSLVGAAGVCAALARQPALSASGS